MKRTLSLAILATLASASAFAQSNVVVYGRLNVSAEHIDQNGAKGWEVVNSASRLGFKGKEDLGGGLFAGFQLEHGFSVDTGASTAGNQFWKRRSEVNIGSTTLGTIRLGNYTSEAYYATADYVSLHNHDTGTSSDALYAYLARNTDKVGYQSPNFGGLTIDAAMSAKEKSTPNERSYDVALNYTKGALHLGGGYQKIGDLNQFAASALYGLGAFTFGGYVQRDEDAYAANAGSRTTLRLSGMYAVGQGEVHLNAGHAGNYSDLSNSSATQYTVGYNHNLSKRTKVYTFFTKINDSSAALYGGDFRSIAFGMRHNF